jgi:predicted RNase H-like HicB family nuclease
MNKEEIAKYIYKYAQDHYNDGGWDVIVECWTINDIKNQIEDGESKEDALKHFKSVVAVWADQEADAANSAW